MSDEDSFKNCCVVSNAMERIDQMLQNLLNRVLKDGRSPQVLRLTVRNDQRHRESRQCPVSGNLFRNLSKDKMQSTRDSLLVLSEKLLRKAVDTTKPFHLTCLNICLTKFPTEVSTLTRFLSHSPGAAAASASQVPTPQELDRTSSTVASVKTLSAKGSLLSFFAKKDLAAGHCRTGRTNDTAKKIEENTCTGETLDDLSMDLSNEASSPRNPKKNQEYSFITDERNSGLSLLETAASVHTDYASCSGLSGKRKRSPSPSAAYSEVPSGVDPDVPPGADPDVPPGVDAAVFHELPRDIQDELIKSWKRKSNMNTSAKLNSASPSVCTKKQKKASILNYFKSNSSKK